MNHASDSLCGAVFFWAAASTKAIAASFEDSTIAIAKRSRAKKCSPTLSEEGSGVETAVRDTATSSFKSNASKITKVLTILATLAKGKTKPFSFSDRKSVV